MDCSRPAPAEWVVLGRIAGLFGVRGQLKVQSYTEPPEGLLRYRRWRLALGHGGVEERGVHEGRRRGRQLVVSLEGIEDCDAARVRIGAEVRVARAELPRLPAGEYYEVDLIGLSVVNEQGRMLGRVAFFLHMPAHPVMVVRGETEHWLPVTPQHLLRVDLQAGTLHVRWEPDE